MFEKGINEFIRNIQTIECQEQRDFCAGYIAHVLTDYFFIQNILDTIYKKCADIKYNSDETLVTGRDFIEEYVAMDGVVLDIFPTLEDVLLKVENSRVFDVEDFVYKEEILNSRAWTIRQIRQEKDFSKKLNYLNRDDFLKMVDESIKYVADFFKQNNLLKKDVKQESLILKK